MKPYFDTNHATGLLILIVMLAWGMMELTEFSQEQERRKGAITIGRRGFWLAAVACTIATNVVLHLAPHLVPAAFEAEIAVLVADLNPTQRTRLSATASLIAVADTRLRGIDILNVEPAPTDKSMVGNGP